MKRPSSLALVASGPTRHNLFVRLPRLTVSLGPVKAPALRISSRIANTLRGGWPAKDWAELAEAEIVVISINCSRVLEELMPEMVELGEFWRGKIVVAADVPLGRHALAPLVCQGAIPASLLSLDTAPPAFILDTDRRTGVRLRKWIRNAGGHVIEASEQAYSAVNTLTEERLPGLFDNAMTVLRQSGLESAEARHLVEVHFHQALRTYLRGRNPIQRRTRWQAVGVPAD